MSWIMVKHNNGMYSIGYYRGINVMNTGSGRYTSYEFCPIKDFNTYEEAAEEIHYLNGGTRKQDTQYAISVNNMSEPLLKDMAEAIVDKMRSEV
ncbi:MAG TPA: hypothetical protein VHK27_14620 [Gammaproteobacteria bacterium]|nr:hypothetical protein [Gammaproteobacteria bacterium]